MQAHEAKQKSKNLRFFSKVFVDSYLKKSIQKLVAKLDLQFIVVINNIWKF